MPELSIEEFRSIKARIIEILEFVNEEERTGQDIPEEQAEALEKEMDQIVQRLHGSDLSKIPFEEYEGFPDLGFDFSGTGANLDYALIDTSYRYGNPVRNKGCTVRNFDFKKTSYDLVK